MTTTPNSPFDDWLPPPPDAPDVLASGPAQPRNRPRWIRVLALAVAGVLGGGGVAYAAGHSSGDASASTSAVGTAATSEDPPGGATGSRADHIGPAGGQAGGLAGEQHLQGTVTAVGGSSVTVQTSAGTHAYQVTSSTEIVVNGAPATLAQVKAGQPVLVHVYPGSSKGRLLVERLFAGTLPSFGDRHGLDGRGDPDGPGDGSSGTDT